MKQSTRDLFASCINLLLIAVLCLAVSMSIVQMPIFTKNSNSAGLSSTKKSDELKQNQVDYKSDRVQNNPFFASTPAWSEDFSLSVGESLKPKYWNILEGPAENSNREQQYYTGSPKNLFVADGKLQIIGRHEVMPSGYEYSSSRIETGGKKEFLYGRIDVRAKLPSGTGTWPAIWMLPANNIYADKSPETNLLRYKNGGEIDILEAIGQKPDVIYGVAHTSSDLKNRSDGTGSHGKILVKGSSKEFNKYSLLWTPEELIYQVNDKTFYNYKKKKDSDYTTWPYDQPFYLIINLALGGTWGGMDRSNFPKNGINNNALPAVFEVDSIDYYPYIGN